MNKLNLCWFMVLLLIFIPSGLYGQKSDQLHQSSKQDTVMPGFLVPDIRTGIGSIEEYIQLNQEHPSEKVFLHLDRPNYMQGDTIWFKAYLWYGYDQLPDTISGILYVDLISAEDSVVLKRKLLIQNGISHGDFCLDSTISPGRYLIRACTRLMQNPNAGQPFYQTVIINPANQNFQFECLPAILKQTGNDSLKIGFRFYEIDPAGNLNSNYKHDITYALKIGDRLLQKGNILATNTEEYVLKYSLGDISTYDSIVEFEISIQDNDLTFEKQFQIPLQERIDMQFFPEGGKLVNGLESKVAFKAIGADGLSREVNGEIKTDDGEVVAGFKSSHKGMGAFLLKPKANKEYFAHLWYNKLKYIIPLPSISKEGSVMSIRYTGDNNDPFLSIKQKPSGGISKKYVIGNAYGKIWLSAQINTFKDSCGLKIPLELLPEGVCRLTILNEDFEPECERLIYIDKNLRFKIEVTPDSSSYGTRSKVSLLIKTTGPNGLPVITDLSLAVVDREQITDDSEVHGISAYKLLESELQGYIEDVDSYFNNGNCTNKSALDLLMLTQGYRKFVPANSNMDEQKFQPEKSFEITGKIKSNSRKSREKKFNYREIDLMLLCSSEDYYLVKSNPDSLGKFRFQIPLMYGKSRLLLQAFTPKKKPFIGDILLDDPITPPQFPTPQPERYPIASTTEEFVSQMQSTRKTERSNALISDSISWKLTLEEVTVKAKAKDWYRRYEKDARKIVDLDTLDPYGNRYDNIYDFLIKEFGAIWHTYPFGLRTVHLPATRTVLLPLENSHGQGRKKITHFPPVYVIDGKTYWNGEGLDVSALYTLWDFPVNEIKRVLVLPPMNSGVMYYASSDLYDNPHYIHQSLVVIETYSKKAYRGDPRGIETFILDGLDAQRVFYSPRYEGPLRNSPVYDGRVTLYWEPSLQTDAYGQAKVEFYTSDRHTTLKVIVNGIEAESGYPGEGDAQINCILQKNN